MKHIALCLLVFSTYGAHAIDATTELLVHARSLACSIDWTYSALFKNGKRDLASHEKKYKFSIDDIDLVKGTARIISDNGAGDVTVRWAGSSLWFMGESAIGNVALTTVFPQYVEGTSDFILVESRHSDLLTSYYAGQSYGRCSVLQ